MNPNRGLLLILLLAALVLAVLIAVIEHRRPSSDATDTPGIDPRRKFILSARSKDGLVWKKEGPLRLLSASTPQVLEIEGSLVLLFVRGGRELERARLFEGTWRARPLTIEGESPGLIVDPHAVKVPGGWRLYYTFQERLTDPGAGTYNEFHSAKSTDFLHWKKEEGVRLAGKSVVDPDVVSTERGWRLYFTKDTSSIYSAFSSDGLAFREEEGRRINLGCVSTTVRAEAGFRMYFHRIAGGKSAVVACDSPDGLTFDEGKVVLSSGDGADREGVESPSVVHLRDGSWFMAYVSYR
jgi:hypothetical protein